MSLEVHPVEVPEGYPREYERRLRLRDGRAVWVRVGCNFADTAVIRQDAGLAGSAPWWRAR
jgi:hypothetical protein